MSRKNYMAIVEKVKMKQISAKIDSWLQFYILIALYNNKGGDPFNASFIQYNLNLPFFYCLMNKMFCLYIPKKRNFAKLN